MNKVYAVTLVFSSALYENEYLRWHTLGDEQSTCESILQNYQRMVEVMGKMGSKTILFKGYNTDKEPTNLIYFDFSKVLWTRFTVEEVK